MDMTIDKKAFQKAPLSSSIIGIIMVIVVEMMFFGGLISAFVLAQAGQVDWPPANQPRLPFWLTFGNMLILLFSAFTLYKFLKNLKEENKDKNTLFLFTIVLGSIFFLIQGYEWVRILLFGLKTGRGLFTSFFYTIIGLHGFHVFIGLILLSFVYNVIRKSDDIDKIKNYAWTASLFWFFVVLLWPVLYYLIYWI